MFLRPLYTTRLAEKQEGRPQVHVPMVYERVAPEPVQWEYHVLSVDTREQDLPDAAQLNELGRDGWILAGMLDERATGKGSRVYYYFVRQGQESNH